MATQQQPPPKLTIATFNLLAPCHKRLPPHHRESHTRSLWTSRLHETITHIRSLSPTPDILCVQEIWCSNRDYVNQFLTLLGHGSWFEIRRGGGRHDGVGMFVRVGGGVLDVMEVGGRGLLVETKNVGEFDRVGLVVWVKVRGGGSVMVGNCHLSFPHGGKSRRVRGGEVRGVVGLMERFGRDWGCGDEVGKVLVGDFNGGLEGKESMVCRFLRGRGWESVVERVCKGDRPITHRNHRGEEVNVDHVFVYEGNEGNGGKEGDERLFDSEDWESDLSVSVGSEKEDENKLGNEVKECDEEKSQVEVATPPPRVALKAVSAEVYPKYLPTSHWPKEFKISDHRPLSVTFDLCY